MPCTHEKYKIFCGAEDPTKKLVKKYKKKMTQWSQ